MTHIEQRGSTAAEWASDNPVLYMNELGWETDTRLGKIGDDETPWNDLDYLAVDDTIVDAAAAAAMAEFGSALNEATAAAVAGFMSDPSSALSDATDGRVAALIADVDSDTRDALDTQIDAKTAPLVTADNARILTVNRPITLRDNPALDFTGVTDSTTALQAALTAAGGRRVEWGREGVLKSGPLTLPEFQSLVGMGQYLGAGGTQLSELTFPGLTGTQVGITGGGNNIIESLLLRGPTGDSNTVGFDSPAGSPRFSRASFHAWGIGTRLTNAYYTEFDYCEWRRNKNALVLSGCTALHLDTPTMYCSYGASDALFGRGVQGTARGLTVTAGVIEAYGSGGAFNMDNGQVLDVTGTYFESSVVGSNAWGVVATAKDKVAINIRGCTVYLNEHTRFVGMADATNVTINSIGNKFVCPTTSAVAPPAFYFNTADVPNIKGRLGHDDWVEVVKVGAVYVPNVVFQMGQLPSLDIRHPTLKYMGGTPVVVGSPNGQLYGSRGNRCSRSDGGAGTSLYVKETGDATNTGWVGK